MQWLVALTLCVMVGCSLAVDISLDDEWTVFVKTYNKSYVDDRETLWRREIWEDNVAYIRSHNLLHDMGHKSFTLGLNMYADLSLPEYRKYLLGFKGSGGFGHAQSDSLFFLPKNEYESLPDQVDWRTKGYVTQVKNQGQCGSCWAFSSTGSLEGQHFRKTGKLVSLSEQNLVDCAKSNAGCHGGWMNNAFKYIASNKGLDTEQSYPYEAQDDNCRYKPDDSGATDSGYVNIDKDNEQALKAAVASIGPIAVAIDASHKSFQLYKSGLYVEPACSNSSTDHAVLAVGYGHMSTDSKHYWLVKNSWSETWGMDGYIQMARDEGNMCAIASFASYPQV